MASAHKAKIEPRASTGLTISGARQAQTGKPTHQSLPMRAFSAAWRLAPASQTSGTAMATGWAREANPGAPQSSERTVMLESRSLARIIMLLVVP